MTYNGYPDQAAFHAAMRDAWRRMAEEDPDGYALALRQDLAPE